MSHISDYTLSPGAVASMTEPTPDLQRNYRQRGMLENYGQIGENGRWKYCLNDLLGFWLCDRLSDHGKVMDRREGFRLGYFLASRVAYNFLAQRRSFVDGPRYAAIVYVGGNGDGSISGLTVKSVTTLDDLNQDEWEYAQIIDIQMLATKIPPQIQGLLIAADENDQDDATPNYDTLLDDAPSVGSDA